MTFSYVSNYDSTKLRGMDDPLTPRPWNLSDEIIKIASADKKLLDIGCGTAFKLIPLAPYYAEIIGVDISQDMVNAAKILVKKNKLPNLKIIHGDSSHLPFANNTFDVITCMVSCWDIPEIFRVLKPEGVVIIEHIGCEDKKEFKLLFGKDEQGWRGQFLDYQKDEFLDSFYKKFSLLFNSVSITEGYWRTLYSPDGLLELLKFTPTIRNFNLNSDIPIFQKWLAQLENKEKIPLIQNRILIKAKNHEKII